jgi:hypothetical protein
MKPSPNRSDTIEHGRTPESRSCLVLLGGEFLYRFSPKKQHVEDTDDGLAVIEADDRILPGGSYSYDAGNVRCAERGHVSPGMRGDFGFRPARTIRPEK